MSPTPHATPTSHPSFTLCRQEEVASLNIRVEEYEHTQTGAKHIHLSSNNPENVFLVALRTVPKDSTGVAHILEHTALCGSERYPVRDPFFMMTRRSLNTFMNAFTSSDWTAYPFASVNRKDFNNLLDVYLDAVFFSRLDELDFAQEGHRLEFSEPNNAESTLTYKGVVFNEMKGAMSSISSQLWQTVSKYLFPTTTYHFNSGGEPDCIPSLTYEQLIQFYKTHYHPSNAIFMTYGDIPAQEHQKKFQEQALARFDKLDSHIYVPDEKRYHAPINVEEYYPVTEEDGTENKTHVVMGWLWGHSANLDDALLGHLISSVLLDNSASPLMQALETSDLGQSPSPMCGLDDSQHELSFLCGLAGCSRDAAPAVEKLILDTLHKVAEEGIPQEDVEAALHQLELHQREVGGDSYPYGLQLILNALTAATHRGDPVSQLNIDRALTALREKIQDPEFIKQSIKALILENQHRVRLTLLPDTTLADRKEQAEANTLANIQAALSEEEKQKIIEQAAALKTRQAQKDDESILPKVTLEDVPTEESNLEGETTSLTRSNLPLTYYHAGTNGLVYQQTVFDLPTIPQYLLQLLPLYTSCLTEMGAGKNDYIAMQRKQAQVTGGFSAYTSIRGRVDDANAINSYLTLSGKALSRNQKALSELMNETIEQARFDETNRLRELISQMRAQREQSITGSGHALAMAAAASGMCAPAKLSHQLTGLAGIKELKSLDDSLKDPENLGHLAEKLQSLHQLIVAAPRRFLVIAEVEQQAAYTQAFSAVFDHALVSNQFTPFSLSPVSEKVNEAWLTNTQVNFCAKAYPTVTMNHPDAAPLVVLGNFLRNGFLHTHIREQGGAYGGGAGQDNNSAAFRFYSYRDPRLEDTLNDFDKAIDWLLSSDHEWQAVEEAILGTVASIDKPDSPAGRAKRMFHSNLHGRTLEERQIFRDRLLSTKLEDLKRVAQHYLSPEKASTAVVTDNSRVELAKNIGLESKTL